MQYTKSVTDFFKSPKWGMNLLLGAVCSLIPMIGPLVLSGWLIGLFWARGDDDNPSTFPPFNFENFVKYLERGLWPFVVSLVASLVLVPVVLVFVFAFMILAAIADGNSEMAEFLFGLIFFFGFIVFLVVMIGFSFITVPLMIKAIITQDFKKSFDFKFAKSFFALVWKELLVSLLFLMAASIPICVIAFITCGFGAYFTAPIIYFSWMHLQKQLYLLYLERGGDAIPLSEQLTDLPPSLPRA